MPWPADLKVIVFPNLFPVRLEHEESRAGSALGRKGQPLVWVWQLQGPWSPLLSGSQQVRLSVRRQDMAPQGPQVCMFVYF